MIRLNWLMLDVRPNVAVAVHSQLYNAIDCSAV